jgi:hypothetical protein
MASVKTTTIYPKSIKTPVGHKFKLLKPGSNNKKLGNIVTAKKWTGKRMFSLTLVERVTCPESCHHWEDCYGNNMPFAHRFNTIGLLHALEDEVAALSKKYPEGIVIRLHVLGDFYSISYVAFWERILELYPNVCIYGYTARWYEPIQKAIAAMNRKWSNRCVIRYSRNRAYIPSEDILRDSWKFAAEESYVGPTFTCPEQLGTLPDCASCGACWIANKTVKFLSH